MSKEHPIFSAISSAFTLNLARKKVLAALIRAVILTRDVNLMILATHLSSDASHSSQYRRLQRFFQKWLFCAEDCASLIFSRMVKPSGGFKLSMDRTNWKFGRAHINILTIAISMGKVSMPLVWTTLPKATKRGNSNVKQRIALMKVVLKVLPVEDIHSITMDREFNGKEWLQWLDDKGIGFVLRLRRNTLVDGKSAGRYRSTRKAKSYEKKSIFEMDLYFGAKAIKSGREDKIYVVSNKFPPHVALELYRSRWGIEVFFGHLKKKGFNCENTHMTDKHKMNKLFAVLALAFLFTIGWGRILREETKLNAHQKRKSAFRLGLDELNTMLKNPCKYKDLLDKFTLWVTGALEPSIFVV